MALLMQQCLWVYTMCTYRKCSARWYFYLIKPPFSLPAGVLKCDLRAVGFLDRVPYEIVYSKAFCCFWNKTLCKTSATKNPFAQCLPTVSSSIPVCCWKLCSFLQCIREYLTGVFSKEKATGGQMPIVHNAGHAHILEVLVCCQGFLLMFFFGPSWRADVLIVRRWVCFFYSYSFLIWVILLETWVQFSL